MSNVKVAPKGKSLDEFRALHDDNFIVPKKITFALEALGDSWLYEGDFIKLCGLNQTKFSAFREQFSEFYIDVTNPKKRVWVGTKTFVSQIRKRLSGE